MKKILVIDDDIEALKVIEYMLIRQKFEVRRLSRWQLIIKTIKDFEPNLILLDIDLGGMDGSEVCRTLRQSSETYYVPVILISVHEMPPGYVKSCKAQGFLHKPINEDDMLKMIKNHI